MGPGRARHDAHAEERMTEDEVKQAVADWLQAQGWDVSVAWGRTRGIDIDATRGTEHFVIEAKGAGRYDQMSRNFFFVVLGDLLQRMTDEHTRHGLALPDMPPFINLVQRFPELARRRTQITFLLASRDAAGFAIREIAPDPPEGI